MKRKPKPPTRVAYCASCDSTYTPAELDNYAGSRDARECPCCYEDPPLLWLDVVPRGGARVVRMARRWHRYRNTTDFHTESEYATDTLLAEDIREAVGAMERKGAKR